MNIFKALKYLNEYGPHIIELFQTIGAIRGLTNEQRRDLALEAFSVGLEHIQHRAASMGADPAADLP